MTLQENGKKLLIIGNYRFTGRLLGKGNFARVEEAVHNILNVKVAVKIMNVKEIKEDYVIRNLYREAKLMAKLNHPCIAALYQTMQRPDNVYYLVTEMAGGGDLCTFIKAQKNGKLSESSTRNYARQFVSALAHMHHLGVVHRDLKMENVMLNPEKTQIKIVDFGLSNQYHPDDFLRTHCGSPEYAAPELFITGRKYGPEVDLWSLGIILYGMVIGQLPFVSNRSDQVSSQERRKKLVAQISRGLGSSHRRALSLFSLEFRAMMNRMLVADTKKRIGIKELVVHPWMTERGRRIIKTNPIKTLETKDQARIISDICCMVKLPPEEVIVLIKNEPFNKVGGIYNILAHMYSLSRLGGDGISRTLPVLNVENVNDKADVYNKEAPRTLRISLTRLTQKSSRIMKTSNTNLIGIPLSKRDEVAGQSSAVKPRPKTVQSIVNREQFVDYRTLKSPTLRRKAYSASISPTASRPSTVSPITTKVAKTMDGRPNQDPEKLYGRDKCLTNALNVLRKVSKGNKPEKPEVSRAKTATERKQQRSKSERLSTPMNRPATSAVAGVSFRRSLQTTTTTKITEKQSTSDRSQYATDGIHRKITPSLRRYVGSE
ncbi:SNF1-related protein kinase catalytic subunit alpha KIN11-like isoform X2 [Sitophilus oryzae]|uniref:SNF1-related protein kinase catalytic subunit alpha KIN11-like isoform X2 n=1 Tax=Sitophilus oryzae TaxID=7048 RepID=A0A6J2X464_SITOR|nr:SNF1-related protein kinase catalytic subunit alpha KIN11-like isoform X2 [Sitophilus oryzae]